MGQSAWCPVLISVSGDQLALALPDRPVQRIAGLAGLPQSASLLVGCRATRKGLPKSLGAARISDVLYWPGVDFLAQEVIGAETPAPYPLGGAQVIENSAACQPAETEAVAPARQLLKAFEDFCLWEL